MNTNERPTLALYHANGKDTGSAMKLQLYPARVGDLDSGAIYATIARQSSLGDRRSTPPVYPRFDWDNALKVKLDFDDLTKILQVLRGETESINDGKGLLHCYSDKWQRIGFRHVIEPLAGYSMEVMEAADKDEHTHMDRRIHFFLYKAEALGLSLAIEHSFAAIAFRVSIM